MLRRSRRRSPVEKLCSTNPVVKSVEKSALTFGGLALQDFSEFVETTRIKQQQRQQHPLGRRKGKQKYQPNNDKLTKDDKMYVIKKHELYSNEDNPITNSSGIPRRNSDGKNLDTPRALQLAFPMTLNNLAGGVAGINIKTKIITQFSKIDDELVFSISVCFFDL